MKNAKQGGRGKSSQQSYSKEASRDRNAGKQESNINIPGGAGAAGQIPIKGNDNKLKDDPLRSGATGQGAS